MPVAAHFDPDTRFVMFRCSGNVAINEAKRAFDLMVTDPAVEPDAHALWDLRSAAISRDSSITGDVTPSPKSHEPFQTSSKCCRTGILGSWAASALPSW